MKLDDWDDLRFVLAVSRAGTLTEASRQLQVDQSTVTRRLKGLEERLGIALFEQLRRGVRLTAAGEAFARHAAEVEERTLALERELEGGRTDLVGTLRLTLPDHFAIVWLPDFRDWAAQHPRLELELIADHQVRNLSRREADVALRSSRAPAEHLIGRRLAKTAVAAYATPELAAMPLDELPWIDWSGADHPDSTTRRGRRRLGATGPFSLLINSYVLQMEGLRRGIGASVLPCICGDAEPGLVRLEDPQTIPEEIWLLTHPDLRRSPRVRALMDWLGGFVAAQQDALLGRGSRHPLDGA